METGEQLAAEILEAIRSGRDLYVFDQFIAGPDRLERARKLLIERRDACSNPEEAAFLTSIVRGLEKGVDGAGPHRSDRSRPHPPRDVESGNLGRG